MRSTTDRGDERGRARLAHWLLQAYRRAVRADRRVWAWLLGRLRRSTVKLYDPDLTVDLFDVPLTIPFSHDLPFTKADHPGYSENLRRTIDVMAGAADGITVVDIGANVGDTVAMAYRPDVEFVCIEGHPDYFSYLERNTSGLDNVTRVAAMVGHPGQRLRLDAARGSASALVDDGGVETRTLAEIVATEVDGARVDLVKVDTDGYDADVLSSSIDWLGERRPALFFEYDPGMQPDGARPIRQVVHDLATVGYRWLLVWDKFGDLLVAVEGDDVMDDLDRYVTRGPDRYFDVFMCDDRTLFDAVRAAEHGKAVVPA